MKISSETVIKKIEEEIDKAKKAKNNDQIIESISKIKLLSELILEESNKETSKKDLIMKTQISSESPANTINDLDGDSIFDF